MANIKKKKFKLLFIPGYLIVDKLIGYEHFSKNIKLTATIQALELKDDISMDKHRYIVKKISLCFWGLTGFILAALLTDNRLNQRSFPVMGLIICALLYRYMDEQIYKRVDRRREQLISDYPEIISKIILLNEAGISIYGSMKRMTKDYGKSKGKIRYAYEEIGLALKKIENNESENQAYIRFGQRCRIHGYIRLGALLAQHITKGNKELGALLQDEVITAYKDRKALIIKKAEQAQTKLLVPMIMILMVIIVIIVVPVFLTIQF